mgnify:CR=1 FL=1
MRSLLGLKILSQMLAMIAEGVKFIVNSDAHSPERVGEVNRGMNFVYKYNIPLSQVANYNFLQLLVEFHLHKVF